MATKKQKERIQHCLGMISFYRFHYLIDTWAFFRLLGKLESDYQGVDAELTFPGETPLEMKKVAIGPYLEALRMGTELLDQHGDVTDRGEILRTGQQRYGKTALLLTAFSAIDSYDMHFVFDESEESKRLLGFLRQARHCIVHDQWKMEGVWKDVRAVWRGIVIERDSERVLELSSLKCLELVDQVLTVLIKKAFEWGLDPGVVLLFYSCHLPVIRKNLKDNPENRERVANYWRVRLPGKAGLEEYGG